MIQKLRKPGEFVSICLLRWNLVLERRRKATSVDCDSVAAGSCSSFWMFSSEMPFAFKNDVFSSCEAL